MTTQSQYIARLVKQAHGTLVPLSRGVLILLCEGELATEEENAFIFWVHKARRLSSMMVLRAIPSMADVRLERKLRYE